VIVFFALLARFDGVHPLPQVSFPGADSDSCLPTALPRRFHRLRDSDGFECRAYQQLPRMPALLPVFRHLSEPAVSERR
jgi:hypothetical protein